MIIETGCCTQPMPMKKLTNRIERSFVLNVTPEFLFVFFILSDLKNFIYIVLTEVKY